MSSVLGISRSPRFSPNSTARDAAIFTAVAAELRGQGHTVSTCCEDDFRTAAGADVVFNMGRGVDTLKRLAAEEAAGLTVVNSATALLAGSRTALTARFTAARLPVAPCTEIRVAAPAPAIADGCRYWLKRGEACAQTAGDVRLVCSTAELEAALADFRQRGIGEALLSAHIEGDLVKFYGVEGTDFFDHYYPTADARAFSKFGLERHNGRPDGYAFSLARLKADADAAARLSGFIVYGGDCIVRPDGSYLIIDFNDWPSFSRCCAPAARAIAARLASARRQKHSDHL